MEARSVARADGTVSKADLGPLLESIRAHNLHRGGADAVKCAAACHWLARIEVDNAGGNASMVRLEQLLSQYCMVFHCSAQGNRRYNHPSLFIKIWRSSSDHQDPTNVAASVHGCQQRS